MTFRALAEVDPTCVGGLVSYGVTTLNALRETISFEKVKLIFLIICYLIKFIYTAVCPLGIILIFCMLLSRLVVAS